VRLVTVRSFAWLYVGTAADTPLNTSRGTIGALHADQCNCYAVRLLMLLLYKYNVHIRSSTAEGASLLTAAAGVVQTFTVTARDVSGNSQWVSP
jgi:hypothetical protein